MIFVLLGCAPEYEIAACPEPEPVTWATTEPCPGYAALWLPLDGDPLAVWWCAGEECSPVGWEVDRWLLVTCPAAGEIRVLWGELT